MYRPTAASEDALMEPVLRILNPFGQPSASGIPDPAEPVDLVLPQPSVHAGLHDVLPLLDPSSVSALSGSVLAVVFGSLTALWSGLGVVRTAQFAFDSVWEVPYHQRPGLVQQTLRSVWR